MSFQDDLKSALFGQAQKPIPQPQDPAVKIVNTKDEGVFEELHNIKLLLMKFLEMQSGKEEVTSEIITFSGRNYEFYHQDRPYSAFLTNQTGTLTIQVAGYAYTLDVFPGLNSVNFPDGARITATTEIQGILYRGRNSSDVWWNANDQFKVVDTNAQSAYAISPSDTVTLPNGVTKGLYVGTGGDVKVTLQNATTVTFSSLSGGTIHPIAAKQVWATGTNATNLLAIY